MPVLRFLLLDGWIVTWVFFHLKDEPDFSRIAEVGNCHKGHFRNKRVSCQLQFILSLLQQVPKIKWLQLHDASDTESLSPLSLIEIAQYVLHVDLVLSSKKLQVATLIYLIQFLRVKLQIIRQ